jgi:glycosyltransferase involved in cell wall biosynthesis
VVYQAVGGVNEVLKNGQYGFQDKDGTIHSLAVALASCILNEEERKNRTKAGQQFVMSHFADDKMIKEFLALSKSVSEAR